MWSSNVAQKKSKGTHFLKRCKPVPLKRRARKNKAADIAHYIESSCPLVVTFKKEVLDYTLLVYPRAGLLFASHVQELVGL